MNLKIAVCALVLLCANTTRALDVRAITAVPFKSINSGVNEDVSHGWGKTANKLFFISANRHQVWMANSIDGTSVLIKDHGLSGTVSASQGIMSNPNGITPNIYWFVNSTEIWTYNGTAASKVASFPEGSHMIDGDGLGNLLYLQTDNFKLWRYNPALVTKWSELKKNGASLTHPVHFAKGLTKMFIYEDTATPDVYADSGTLTALTAVNTAGNTDAINKIKAIGDVLYYQIGVTGKLYQYASAETEVTVGAGHFSVSIDSLFPGSAHMYIKTDSSDKHVYSHPKASAGGDVTLVAATVGDVNNGDFGNADDLYFQDTDGKIYYSAQGVAAVEVAPAAGGSYINPVNFVRGATKVYVSDGSAHLIDVLSSGTATSVDAANGMSSGMSGPKVVVIGDNIFYSGSTDDYVYYATPLVAPVEVTPSAGGHYDADAFLFSGTTHAYIYENLLNAYIETATGGGAASSVFSIGTGNNVVNKSIVVNDTLFFHGATTPHGLWVSLGGAVAVEVTGYNHSPSDIQNCTSPYEPVQVGSNYFFVANDGVHGCELWTTNGTSAGTHLVKDVHAGLDSSDPTSLTVVGTRVYFKAIDANGNAQLYFSDAPYNAASTSAALTDNGAMSPVFPDPTVISAVGGTLFFASTDLGVDNLAYVKGGTAASPPAPVYARSNTTHKLVIDKSVKSVVPLAAKAMIRGYDGTLSVNYNLWMIDTATPTVSTEFTAIQAANTEASLTFFSNSVTGGQMFFSAANPKDGVELWRTAGTNATTVEVADVNTDPNSNFGNASPLDLHISGANIFFTAYSSGSMARQLFVTAAPFTSATQLTDWNNPTFTNLRSFGVKSLTFTATDDSGVRFNLFSTDGTTPASVVKLLDVTGNVPTFNQRSYSANGFVFWSQDSISATLGSDHTLMMTDGTIANTKVAPGTMFLNMGHFLGSDSNFGVVEKNLTFVADDGEHGPKIWYTNGVTSGMVNAGVTSEVATPPKLLGYGTTSAFYFALYFVQTMNSDYTLVQLQVPVPPPTRQ